VVSQIARGLLVRRLPCRSLKRWGERVQVILDRSDRLVPYWDDQVQVLNRLKRIIPEHGLEVFVGSSPDSGPIRKLGESYTGGSVLVLGDLGALQLSGDRLQEAWQAWGQALRESGCHPLALVPCAVDGIPSGLRQTFTVSSWQPLPHAHVEDPDDRRKAVERLLGLLSPAIRIEPGLLREVRTLLPGPGDAAADASLESELWQHPTVVSRHVSAATLDAEHASKVLMPQFENESQPLRSAVLDVIRKWRHPLPAEVWLQEVMRLAPDSRRLVPDQDWKDAQSALNFLARKATAPGGEMGAVRDYLGRALARVTDAAWSDREIGPVYRMLHRAILSESQPPEGWDPAEEDRGDTLFTLEIRQQGRELTFSATGPVAQSAGRGGSPFGWIQTTNKTIRVDADAPPPWADDWGRDHYGPWATIRVGNVTQRLRWIPPGRFWMGSPESEEGRWDDEGPRHEVTISVGYWMFETPCTQELWEAVMGKNPSRFPGARRPVERVSWDECQEFVGKLNAQVLGLECRFPREAEWEYACRAGASGARYGPLDEVAWHSGNSSGETHEVGVKQPNDWGLCDMLGNVYEWCFDGIRKYANDKEIDPVGPTEAGADRVFRGGSWFYDARRGRAAHRHAYPPDVRVNNLGFRCLSSGRFSPAEVEPAAEVGGRKAEPGPQPEQAGGTVEVRLRDAEPGRCRLPRSPRILIWSDLHEIELERSSRPRWATAIGRDTFGLWATFEIDRKEKPVVQRMRWIPPGRFLMGSPETEPGRFDNEGPQHEVIISQGYWLFDTPCTQELWLAVIGGENPSHFQDPQRPIEQVSLDDVERFLTTITGLVEGLVLTLPTEAQWEYACRAGTTTSTYVGDVEIVGDNNAPGLDAIAWYGGNSGHDFDLQTGWDSSGWPEMQYPHTKAGIRKVGEKLPNAWGLYDMLGNVWQWCSDGQRNYTNDRAIDPVEAMEAGADRVIRGGGWYCSARVVRAANRYAYRPGSRDGSLGFRCLCSGRF
jgi:formylglycine-generating enzyme required for sulfatase activity